MKKTLLVVGLVALGLGCGKKDDAGGGGKEGGKSGDKTGDKAPAAKMEWMKVGALGIEAEVAAGTKIDDNTAGAGFPTATIWASPTTFVSAQNDMSWKADMEKQKEEIKTDPNKFQKFTKEEKTADGFHLEFTLESMMDQKPIYGVAIRRKVGEKLYDCGSNTDSEANRAKVIKLCSSLRAAK